MKEEKGIILTYFNPDDNEDVNLYLLLSESQIRLLKLLIEEGADLGNSHMIFHEDIEYKKV